MEDLILIPVSKHEFRQMVLQTVKEALGSTPPQYQYPPKKEKDVLNVDEAADLLNLSKQTVYTLTSKREVPFFKRGKKLYFKRAELLDWIEQSRKQTIAEMQQETNTYLSRRNKR